MDAPAQFAIAATYFVSLLYRYRRLLSQFLLLTLPGCSMVKNYSPSPDLHRILPAGDWSAGFCYSHRLQ